MALPQELGGAYTYLLSDQASYTTGIDIPIAGELDLVVEVVPPGCTLTLCVGIVGAW